MENSILDSIKQMLNVDTSDDAFDTEITIHINSAFSTLRSLGIGPDSGFSITGSGEQWAGFLQGADYLNEVKTWMHLKVRLVFDPPGQSFVIDALTSQLKEHEFRMYISADQARKDAANAQSSV